MIADRVWIGGGLIADRVWIAISLYPSFSFFSSSSSGSVQATGNTRPLVHFNKSFAPSHREDPTCHMCFPLYVVLEMVKDLLLRPPPTNTTTSA